MTDTEMKKNVLIALVALVTVFTFYQYDPSFFGLLRSHEGFEDEKKDPNVPAKPAAKTNGAKTNGAKPDAKPDAKSGAKPVSTKPTEAFADLSAYEGEADFGSAEAPAGCYPRDQLTPSELLPGDMNSIWAEQNPMGPGSLKGKNFLSAGALIGVNTVGQSLRNANLQVRSEPPNPQVSVSIFNQSTISPDISHRPLEIGA